jgi:hypothetical protein
VVLLDLFDRPVKEFCRPSVPCVPINLDVTATIYNNPGCGQLIGTTVEPAVGGVAVFSDLMIDRPAELYTLRFSVGLKAVPVVTLSPPFPVLTGQVPTLWEKSFKLVFFCNEADGTNAFLLLINIMLCSKLHCQKVFNQKLFP